MTYIISRYNQDVEWVKEYTDDYVIYDRSKEPVPGSVVVPNIGSDIYDKFSYIIEHYSDLPAVAVFTKANLFKYITKEEFEKVKDNTVFTPLLTQNHETDGVINFYRDGLYYEINNYWYLGAHPAKWGKQIRDFFKMDEREYNGFAPGSNYILTRENILKHPKIVYEELRSYLEWSVYPGDAQMMERNLYYLWS